MQIRNKYYPYPVIVDGGDYYENSSFSSNVVQEMDGYNVKLTITSDLNDEQLWEMIQHGEVIFAHHIECPQTCYRAVKKTSEKETTVILEDAKVNGVVQVCSFVVAAKDIEKYTNNSFSPDYRGWKFNIDKGCILAIGNQFDVRINKIKDDLANTASIFSIVPNYDPMETKVIVDWGQQKIVIKLPEKTYQQYYTIQNYLDNQPIMHSMIIIPALVYVFSVLQEADDLEEMEYYRWYRGLRKACEGIDVKLDNENIQKMDSFQVAQQLLNCPIIKAIDIYSSGGGAYED